MSCTVNTSLVDAVRQVVVADCASVDHVATRMRISDVEACRLLELMCELGIVGDSDGAGVRPVLLPLAEALEVADSAGWRREVFADVSGRM